VLPDQHRLAFQRRQHLDLASCSFDARRSDEDEPSRAAVVEGLEAVDLPPVRVAADGDVEPAIARAEDEARAGGEDGVASFHESIERVFEASQLDQLVLGRALSAGEDQLFYACQVFRCSHFCRGVAGVSNGSEVCFEASLEREHANQPPHPGAVRAP
jgi:hypothetical protein